MIQQPNARTPAITPGTTIPVLIVADEAEVGAALAAEIEAIGIEPRLVDSAHGAVEVLLQNATAVIVADGRIRKRGVDLVEMAQQISPDTRLLIIEPPGSVERLPDDVLVLEQPAHPILLRRMVAAALGIDTADGGAVLPPLQHALTEQVELAPPRRKGFAVLMIALLALAGVGAGAAAFFLLRGRNPAKSATITHPTPAKRTALSGSADHAPVSSPLAPTVRAKAAANVKADAANTTAPATAKKRITTPTKASKVVRPATASRTTRPSARRKSARTKAKPRTRPALATRPKPTRAKPTRAKPATTPAVAKANAAKPSATDKTAKAPPTKAKPAKRSKPRIGTVGNKRKPNIGMLD